MTTIERKVNVMFDIVQNYQPAQEYSPQSNQSYEPLHKNDGIFKLMEVSLTTDWFFDWSKINVPSLIMTGHLDKMFRIP